MLIQSTQRPSVQKAPLAQANAAPVVETPTKTPASEPIDTGILSGDAGKRVGHFVRGVTLESLQHLRYLSAANAFQNIGSTVGSLALTPLAIHLAKENAPLIGGLAIGGTVAAGAVGAVLGYAWLHHRDGKKQEKTENFSKFNDAALALGATWEALPKVVYPSIIGATEAQREHIYQALDRLPLHHVTASATMEVVPNLVDTGISGMAQPGSSHVRVLFDQGYVNSQHGAQHLVLHEQAHAVDYSGGFGLLGAHNWRAGFGKGPFVSSYAESNRYEDFAESFEAYYDDPAKFKADFPEKAAAIERLSHANPLQQAVDQPGVRRMGRRTGELLGKVPHLRTGLELAASLVAPIQVHRGANKLVQGLESGDETLKLQGKLSLASGLFLSLPGAAPLALATSVAGAAIKTTADEDSGQHSKEANVWADRVLATSAGPVGMTLAAVGQELSANGLRLDASQGFDAEGWKAARPSKGAMLKGTLSTVGGTVGGALLGAGLGAVIAGHGGAAVGALWGQLAGGAIGLAGYSIHRTLSQDANDPLALTKDDKRFLGRTIGGAVVGGGVGTVAGSVGGRMAGELLGGALAGPGGANVLGTLGGWVGGLGGAFGGAKLGASFGSGRLLSK